MRRPRTCFAPEHSAAKVTNSPHEGQDCKLNERDASERSTCRLHFLRDLCLLLKNERALVSIGTTI